MTIHYLTKQHYLEINHYAVTQVGGLTFGVQSESSLDMIIDQPKQVVFGQELYPTIWLKAAFILQKITKKHVFRDGNKRTAIQSALYFLYINDYDIIDDDLINNSEDFVLAVTNSPDNEETMLQIAGWLEQIHDKKR